MSRTLGAVHVSGRHGTEQKLSNEDELGSWFRILHVRIAVFRKVLIRFLEGTGRYYSVNIAVQKHDLECLDSQLRKWVSFKPLKRLRYQEPEIQVRQSGKTVKQTIFCPALRPPIEFA
jgi:hypothetical protein